MKNIFIFVLTIVLIFPSLNSCKQETIEDAKKLSLQNDFKTITRNTNLENYQIKVPKYMEPTKILNPEADFQFLHLYNEEYIIIISESKNAFKQMIAQYNEFKNEKKLLNQYARFQTLFLTQKMDILNKSALKKEKINNLNSLHLELLAKLEQIDENIFYSINYIEGKENFYFVMAWTLESKKDVFKEKYKKIISSFKILVLKD